MFVCFSFTCVDRFYRSTTITTTPPSYTHFLSCSRIAPQNQIPPRPRGGAKPFRGPTDRPLSPAQRCPGVPYGA